MTPVQAIAEMRRLMEAAPAWDVLTISIAARNLLPMILDHAEAETARAKEQHDIVARIWKIFGNPSYEELAGRTIYDLIEADRARTDALQARVKELEAVEQAAESVEDGQHGQDAADRAVMSLEAMAFNWIATTDIHKAIAHAATSGGPQKDKLASCIHGLVSQAWIEGADTGFDARRKLTVAAREQVAEFEVLPDRGDLVAWLIARLTDPKEPSDAK